MNYCPVCDNDNALRKKIVKNFIYNGCEISDVKIKNAELWVCSKCGEICFDGVVTRKWHNEIAWKLIKKRMSLTAVEIQFLRSTILSLTLNDMEQLFGIDKSAISKWETGVNKINPSADRMLRILVEDFLKGRDEYRRTLEKYASLIRNGSSEPLKIAI